MTGKGAPAGEFSILRTLRLRMQDLRIGQMDGAPTRSARLAWLVAALETAERLLGQSQKPAGPSYILRPHQPGDIGWIIHHHGVLYAEEYGLDQRFEDLIVRIAAAFIEDFDAARERCWIAERQGAIAGAVLLVKDSDEVAKLRLLYVEPEACGPGIRLPARKRSVRNACRSVSS